MTEPASFKTCCIDTASAVYEQTSEIPEFVQVGDRLEARFYDSAAPDAARRFRNNNPLQNYLSAKKVIYRLFQRQLRGGA